MRFSILLVGLWLAIFGIWPSENPGHETWGPHTFNDIMLHAQGWIIVFIYALVPEARRD